MRAVVTHKAAKRQIRKQKMTHVKFKYMKILVATSHPRPFWKTKIYVTFTGAYLQSRMERVPVKSLDLKTDHNHCIGKLMPNLNKSLKIVPPVHFLPYVNKEIALKMRESSTKAVTIVKGISISHKVKKAHRQGVGGDSTSTSTIKTVVVKFRIIGAKSTLLDDTMHFFLYKYGNMPRYSRKAAESGKAKSWNTGKYFSTTRSHLSPASALHSLFQINRQRAGPSKERAMFEITGTKQKKHN